MKELLKQLREMPGFDLVMDGLKQFRPVVPSYKPGESLEDSARIIEEIKFQSGRQDGFDLLYRALTGK